MSIITDLHDNPILVKHLRARLRRQHLLPLIIVIVSLCICLTFGALSAIWQPLPQDNAEYLWHILLVFFFIMQGLILMVGMAQVATSVAMARENGMMDFHRVSPLTPRQLALGFIVGAPSREYLLFGVTLPFYLLLIMPYASEYPGLWLLPFVLLVLSLLYNLLGLLVGVSQSRLQLRNAGGSAAALLVLCQAFFWLQPLSHLTIVSPITSALISSSDFPPIAFTFFGLPVPPIILALLHQIRLCIFLWIAVMRKMCSEIAFSYSRPTAIIFFIVLGLLLTGDLAIIVPNNNSTDSPYGAGPLILLYVLTMIAMGFIAATTPRLSQIIKGIRYTHKIGLPQMSHWSEHAVNWPVVVNLAVLTSLFSLIAVAIAMLAGAEIFLATSLFAIGTAVLTVLGFGFGLQSFHLMNRKHGTIIFALCLFLLWFLPVIIGAVALAIDPEGSLSAVIMSISPITGISTAYLESTEGITSITNGMIAISSAFFSTTIFGLLYLRAIRRIDAEVPAPQEKVALPMPSAVG